MPDQQDKSSGRPSSSDAERQLQSWYSLAGVGFEFIAAVLFCGGVGWFLDRKFASSPWLTISGAGLGFAVGLWLMVKAANRSFKK